MRQIRRGPREICRIWDQDSWDELLRPYKGAPVSTDTELGDIMREFEFYMTKAGMSREAWGRAVDASDLAHGEVISLRTTVHAQMVRDTELQSAGQSDGERIHYRERLICTSRDWSQHAGERQLKDRWMTLQDRATALRTEGPVRGSCTAGATRGGW
ncbi:hypothetical protein Tco_0105088 [Tanacetum coccineum]